MASLYCGGALPFWKISQRSFQTTRTIASLEAGCTIGSLVVFGRTRDSSVDTDSDLRAAKLAGIAAGLLPDGPTYRATRQQLRVTRTWSGYLQLRLVSYFDRPCAETSSISSARRHVRLGSTCRLRHRIAHVACCARSCPVRCSRCDRVPLPHFRRRPSKHVAPAMAPSHIAICPLFLRKVCDSSSTFRLITMLDLRSKRSISVALGLPAYSPERHLVDWLVSKRLVSGESLRREQLSAMTLSTTVMGSRLLVRDQAECTVRSSPN